MEVTGKKLTALEFNPGAPAHVVRKEWHAPLAFNPVSDQEELAAKAAAEAAKIQVLLDELLEFGRRALANTQAAGGRWKGKPERDEWRQRCKDLKERLTEAQREQIKSLDDKINAAATAASKRGQATFNAGRGKKPGKKGGHRRKDPKA